MSPEFHYSYGSLSEYSVNKRLILSGQKRINLSERYRTVAQVKLFFMHACRKDTEGPARNGRLIHVLCRFKEDANLIIITVYAL